MKKIYAFIFIPTAFFVALLLFPASMNKSEIVDGYRSTVQFSSSNMAYSFYLSQFDDVTNNAADIGYAESVRDRIVSLAVSLCEKYGNGGSMQYSPSSLRRQGQFRYSLDMVDGARVGYNTMDDMRNQLKKMSADPSTTGNISCCGFALFCWDTMLSGQSFYGTICSIAVKTHFQDIIEGDGALAYIKQYANLGIYSFIQMIQAISVTPLPCLHLLLESPTPMLKYILVLILVKTQKAPLIQWSMPAQDLMNHG